MNLDFGILWIEDSYSEQEEESLRRRARESGFIARIEAIPNGDDLDRLARRQALFHCFDLILLDYKLKNADGDDLAPTVRRLFPSTTILFYSGNEEEDGLRSLIAAKRVEGVYCSHRRRFIERTGALIDQTARALDRLSGMRGLAMRVVAECDSLMKQAVRSCTDRDQRCVDLLGELDGDVVNHLEKVRAKYEEACRQGLDGRLGSFAVDSAKLFKHFRRVTRLVAANAGDFGLDGPATDRLRELRRASAQFDADVLGKRNVLGHAREVEGVDGWRLEGGDGIGVADFPRIRQVFAGYIDAFREVDRMLALDGEQA